MGCGILRDEGIVAEVVGVWRNARSGDGQGYGALGGSNLIVTSP